MSSGRFLKGHPTNINDNILVKSGFSLELLFLCIFVFSVGIAGLKAYTIWRLEVVCVLTGTAVEDVAGAVMGFVTLIGPRCPAAATADC